MITPGLAKITGHVKIHDPKSGEIFYNDHNAIHYENISIAMAQTLADRNTGYETIPWQLMINSKGNLICCWEL